MQSKLVEIYVLLFFTRTKQPHTSSNLAEQDPTGWLSGTTPSKQYAAIYALQLRSKPDASSYWPFKWPTPGPVQDIEQLFLGSRLHTMHHVSSYTCAKSFHLWNLTLNIFHVVKKSVWKSVKQQIEEAPVPIQKHQGCHNPDSDKHVTRLLTCYNLVTRLSAPCRLRIGIQSPCNSNVKLTWLTKVGITVNSERGIVDFL